MQNMEKNMKKIAVIAIFALLVVMFTGCSADADVKQSGKPSVVGVKDFECIVNSNIDFLDGVAALDYEDGDITDRLEIKVSPEVPVTGGRAYFSQVGEYEVNYKITDSDGNVATKRSFVDVVDRETYRSFKMPNGFSVRTNGNAQIVKSGMENGDFKLQANGGEVAEDIMLERTFTMICGYQYTFTYAIVSSAAGSSAAGKVKVLADGVDCAEFAVKAGENAITFEHTANKVDDNDEVDVNISVCFGSLGSPELTIRSVETEYYYPDNMRGTKVERAEDFNFAARVSSRIDDDGGRLDLKGNAWSDNDGTEACLEITSTNSSDIWRGGMFINTGIALKKDTSYNVSFDISAKEKGKFEVIIQNSQWNEKQLGKMEFETSPAERQSASFVVAPDQVGSLWIYVQSGTNVNEIRLSKLSVKETLGESEKLSYPIEDFVESGDNAEMTTQDGGFVYEISKFAETDNAQKITSPSFFIAGSSANYVVTFKAKASAPIELVIAAPIYGGWDPTIMWSRIYLTEKEQAFTFFCNGNASDKDYVLEWQFGSVNNQRFSNVTIEISEIKISLRNGESDV